MRGAQEINSGPSEVGTPNILIANDDTPVKPSILDLIRTDLETSELNKPPPTPERAPQQQYVGITIMSETNHLLIQRIPGETQQQLTPRADPRMPTIRPRPALALPRPRASSAPPSAHPAKRLAVQYLPVTKEITPHQRDAYQ